MPTPTPGPVTIHIAPDGSGDYPTLEKAVAEVYPGSTVMLDPGTYVLVAPLRVLKTLHLAGAGMDETEILSSAEDYVLYIEGSGPVTVEDVTLRHQGSYAADAVVVAEGDVTFTRCRFTGAVVGGEWQQGVGLRFQGQAKGVVQTCMLDSNERSGILVEGDALVTLEANTCTANDQAGIIFWDTARGLARDNTCVENRRGFWIGNHAQPTLERNTVNQNPAAGIYYQDSAAGIARSNECSDNQEGIHVAGQAQPQLVENRCHDNRGSGIIFRDDAGGQARQNECRENEWGIAAVEQSYPLLHGNLCTGNQVGILVADTAGPHLMDNECSDNLTADLRDQRPPPTPEPTPLPDLSAVVITLDDLPVGFEELPPEESGLDQEAETLAEECDCGVASLFAFWSPDDYQFVYGYTLLMHDRFQQSAFDALLRQPDYLATYLTEDLEEGEVVEQHTVTVPDDIGETSAEYTVVVGYSGFGMRMDLIVFRREGAGVFITVIYVDGEKPLMPARKIARLLDGRILEALASD